jgi:putrescine transport system substrate-binding protein
MSLSANPYLGARLGRQLYGHFDPRRDLGNCGTIDADRALSPPCSENLRRFGLNYFRPPPSAPSPQDLDEAGATLNKIRPYIRTIDSTNIIQAMANGDICVALGYSGDFVQARKRAREANNGVAIGFVIPEEGSLLWFDMLAIPRDAPNAANAHLFINYLLEPGVIAAITNFIGFANANSRATPLLDASIVSDTIVYPPPGQQQRLFVQTEDSPEQTRAITRIWQKFKVGQ